MKTAVGNHVGLVVNTNDPENRGRVQVYIPHISTTLYNNWNEKLENIEFKTFEENIFDAEIKERLLSLLPWAEAAVPIWGGGTGAPINGNGEPTPFPTDQSFSYSADPSVLKNGTFLASKNTPWSGGFISSIANSSGSNFPSNLAHAGYVDAISSSNNTNWQRLDPKTTAPKIGDIVVGSRVGGSHGDVVTSVGSDGTLTVVGGNVSQSVTQYTKKITSNDYAIIRATSDSVASNMASNATNEYKLWSLNGWNEKSPDALGRLSQYYAMQPVSTYSNGPSTSVTGKVDPREWNNTGLESKDGNMNANTVHVAKTADLSKLNPNLLRGLYGLGMAETGFNSGIAVSNANNQLETINEGNKLVSVRNSNIVNEYNKNGNNFAAAQQKWGDYGFFQVNSVDNNQAGTSLNSGSASEQLIKTADYIKKINPNAYSALEKGDYNTAYDLLKGKWPSLNPNVPTNNLDKAYAALNTDTNTIIKNVENAGNVTPPNPSSGNKIFRTTNQGIMATGSYNAGRIGGPAGMFSPPSVGAKVWVFFQAENPQRPVYFANVYEPSNAAAAGVPS